MKRQQAREKTPRRGLLPLLCLSVAMLSGPPLLGVDATRLPVLHLANGDFVEGRLAGSDSPDVLSWRGAAFTETFSFARRRVSTIEFPRSTRKIGPQDCLELVGGDLIHGSLIGLSTDGVEIQSRHLGRIRLDRSRVRRILRGSGQSEVVYIGPRGLAGWDAISTKELWREEAGHLVTDQPNAVLHGSLGVPPRATIEFQLSWKGKPDFVFALGVDRGPESIARAARIENWDNQLAVILESDVQADLASVSRIEVDGRVHLRVYLDQPRKRILVFSPNGERLADLKVDEGESRGLPGIRLINQRGSVRLERLRISHWDGRPPREVESSRSRVHLADGTLLYGELEEFDAATGEFLIRTGSAERRVRLDDTESVWMSDSDEPARGSTRAILKTDEQLTGELIKVTESELWLTIAGSKEPLVIPVALLGTLEILDSRSPRSTNEPGTGRLEMSGVQLRGKLAASDSTDANCLIWHPRDSTTASPLKREAAGRIVFRERPPPRPKPKGQPRSRPAGFWEGFARAFSAAQPAAPRSNGRPTLFLRTGDTIPCEVEGIDEKGLLFKTELSDAAFVEHRRIKAVELAPLNQSIRVGSSKRDRLLTLPRMRRDDPPTHLIRSTSGDYLRARLISMDRRTLTVEVRLETKQLPRDRVSRIIWLHEDELAGESNGLAWSHTDRGTLVQALRSDGIRLTFHPERFAEMTLSGRGEVLGACRVKISDVDLLLIGSEIERAASDLAYQRWKLRHASDPLFVAEGEDKSSRLAGKSSPLIGQSAADFQLKLLGGERFRLSDEKGRVIVLDFWASWCGPCMTAMPQVDHVIREFQDDEVRLIAVNLQENPDRIRAALERLDLEMAVALDVDGAVAHEYSATAIPQTVIIDREGRIARVFVGGGAKFDEQLRDALREVLTGE